MIVEEPRAAALGGGGSQRAPDSADDGSYQLSLTLRDSSLQPQNYLPPHHTTPWLPQSIGRANRVLHTQWAHKCLLNKQKYFTEKMTVGALRNKWDLVIKKN